MIDPAVVRAANGTLDAVTVTNPGGKEITGALSADRTTWTSGEPLGYARRYRGPPEASPDLGARRANTIATFMYITALRSAAAIAGHCAARVWQLSTTATPAIC